MFARKPKVYLEIDENRLFIGKLKEKKGIFFCDVFDEWPLTSFEVKDGVIYKPSVLYLLIKSFLNDNRLKGSNAIVCCPYLSNWKGVDRRLPFFQISLYVSKVGLKVHSLLGEGILQERKEEDSRLAFDRDELKKRFDFFCHFKLRKKKEVLSWIATTCLLTTSFVVGAAIVHMVTAKKRATFFHQRQDLDKKLSSLGPRVPGAANAVQLNKSMHDRKLMTDVFGLLSGIIPPRTWLTGFKVVRKRLELRGLSTDYGELFEFQKKLSQSPILKKCGITYGQKGELVEFTIKAHMCDKRG